MSGPDDLRCEKVVGVEGNRTFLFWVEIDGDNDTVHMIAYARGVGSVDIKLTAPSAQADAIWTDMVENRFVRACAHVLETIKGLEHA